MAEKNCFTVSTYIDAIGCWRLYFPTENNLTPKLLKKTNRNIEVRDGNLAREYSPSPAPPAPSYLVLILWRPLAEGKGRELCVSVTIAKK